jgi:phospholipid/cholesterol/gamma-HCH transport system ATP-binding protein
MISIQHLKKTFDGVRWVTNDLSLDIPSGQMTCIIGRSGEGKSLLLKQLVGLIRPTSGKIIIDGVDITTLKSNELQDVFKKCGYVFQFAALLDSLNVLENVGLSMIERGVSLAKIKPIVEEKLQQVNLISQEVLYKYPSELSGGMRKRVGLARTLMSSPSTILYDEPTTGLDPITSRVVHELLYNMQNKFKLTSVVVTHDVEFFKYADNIALLYEGAIKYFGSAKTVWESDNPYVYQFVRGLQEGPIQTEQMQRDAL